MLALYQTCYICAPIQSPQTLWRDVILKMRKLRLRVGKLFAQSYRRTFSLCLIIIPICLLSVIPGNSDHLGGRACAFPLGPQCLGACRKYWLSLGKLPAIPSCSCSTSWSLAPTWAQASSFWTARRAVGGGGLGRQGSKDEPIWFPACLALC